MSFLLFKISPVPTDTRMALPKTGISEHPAVHKVMLPIRFQLWKCPVPEKPISYMVAYIPHYIPKSP